MNFGTPPETLRIAEVHKIYRCVVHVRPRPPTAGPTVALTYFLRQPVCPSVVAGEIRGVWTANGVIAATADKVVAGAGAVAGVGAREVVAQEPLKTPVPLYGLLDDALSAYVILNRGGDLDEFEEKFIAQLSEKEKRVQRRWMCPRVIPTGKVYDLSDATDADRWRAVVAGAGVEIQGAGAGAGAGA